MPTVPRRDVDGFVESLRDAREPHLTTTPEPSRILGVLDAVADGATLDTVSARLHDLADQDGAK